MERVLAALREHGSRVAERGDRAMAQCPADGHDDRHASLSIAQGDTGAVIYCHAGCDTMNAILPALGLAWADLFDQALGSSAPAPRRVSAEYRYADERGEVLFVKVRYEPKDFRVKRPDGRGGWAWSLGKDTPRVLYRMAEVRAAVRDGRKVYLVEGEKDADRLAALGETATCNFDGAAKDSRRPKWRPEYGDMLRGADVIIIADRDDAGVAHARAAARNLAGKARTVSIMQSAVDREHADVSDHLDAGHGLGDLVPLAPVPAAADDPVMLPEPPAYPVEALVGPLRSFVDWAIRDGLHPEAAGAAGLAALVTLTGPARLQINDAKTVRAILWIVLVGIASSGKSPAFEHAFARIMDRYDIRLEKYELQHADWQKRREAGEDAGRPPRRPQPMVIDDATLEAIARWVSAREQHEKDASGSAIDDELADILQSLNQYRGGHGGDRAKWLKLWTGAPLNIQRVGKGGAENEITMYVRNPVVNLAGPLTNDNVYLLGKQGSGFRPRWLPHMAPPRRPAWNHAGPHPKEWGECIDALHDHREPRTWFLKDAARTEWEQARARWTRQQDEAEPDDVIEALRKADVQCYRIALVIAESIHPGLGGDIPPEAVRCAVAIVDYVIGCWRALPGAETMSASRAEDVMDAVSMRFLAWLESRPAGTEGLPPGAAPRPRANRREIQQWIHLKASKLTALIIEHAERYPGCVVSVPRPSGPPATFVYAPERRKPTVAATVDRRVHIPPGDEESAGQRSSDELLPTRNSSSRNSSPATVQRDPAETGRCSRCGAPCRRYGPSGAPLCDACRPVRQPPPAPPIPAQPRRPAGPGFTQIAPWAAQGGAA